MISQLYESGYRPHFSGHMTFPLRHGWLKKAYDAVKETDGEARSPFLSEGAIARFGVGKNMVAAMRHWAVSAGVIKPEAAGKDSSAEFGERLFDDGGYDPYMQNPSTSWLVHWNLSGRPTQKTTWFWTFNHFNNASFERGELERSIENLVEERGWGRISKSTIKRDVACLIGVYAPRPFSKHSTYEDAVESPLTELGLIKQAGRRDSFRLLRGPKRSLGAGAFSYALWDFWRGYSSASSLSFDALIHEPGSPGRVFLLDELSLYSLCEQAEQISGGVYRWSETAGLRQLAKTRDPGPDFGFEMLEMDYK